MIWSPVGKSWQIFVHFKCQVLSKNKICANWVASMHNVLTSDVLVSSKADRYFKTPKTRDLAQSDKYTVVAGYYLRQILTKKKQSDMSETLFELIPIILCYH